MKKGRYAKTSSIGGLVENPTKNGMQTNFYKENYLKMTNNEINKLCDWIDKNIYKHVGCNEWGCLRVVNPDNLKGDLMSLFEEKELMFGEINCDENALKVQKRLREMKNDFVVVITKHDIGILRQ